MSPRITHSKVSGKPNPTDTTKVGGNDWDADHVITGLDIGTDVQAHDTTLDALAAFDSNGILVQYGTDQFTARTLTGTANEITVTNGAGASGNPTFSLPSALTFTGKTVTGGLFDSIQTTGVLATTASAGIPTKETGQIWWDNTGQYTERNAAFNINMDTGGGAPSSIIFAEYTKTQSKGTNSTFVGSGGKYIAVLDRPDVDASNKGVLYGLTISARPLVDRNNVPFDDVACIVAQNDGTGKGTAAVEIARNSANFPGAAPEWGTAIGVVANADYAFVASGHYQYGLDFCAGGHNATISAAAVRVPNNVGIVSRNNADNANIGMLRVGSDDGVYLRDGLLAVYAGFTNSSQPINLLGSSSGAISLKAQAAAGTFNWNFPITAGAAGDLLVSGGGGSTAMSWLTPGTNVATFLSTPSSANLAAAITDETGSGSLVFGTSPTFTTQITAPKIIGGSGTSGAQLVIQTTSGVGSSETIEFRGGDNGATLFGYWTAAGFVVQTGGFYYAGTKVVGARDTGWTAMTGTADKASTYDTSTVTLAQLAGRVMAMQTALTTHGLLGT